MSAPADPDRFRALMARWATGVSVVTAHGPAGDVGLTVNAFLSVSLEPPTVLVSLSHDADSTPVLAAGGRFAVNVLAADQRALSDRFARSVAPAEKFGGLALARGRTGAPLLAGTLGAIEARVTAAVPVRDHTLFVGEVVEVHPGREGPPLLFFDRGYAEAEGPDRLRLPAPRAAKR